MPLSADEAVAPDQPLAGKEKSRCRCTISICDHDELTDVDGTELADIEAAREHADTVARELTFKTSGIQGEPWSKWAMVVHDGGGLELFSFGMSTAHNGK